MKKYDVFICKDYEYSRPLLLFQRYSEDKIFQFATWIDEEPDWTPSNISKTHKITFDKGTQTMNAYDFFEMVKFSSRQDIIYLGSVKISINDPLKSSLSPI